MMHEPIYQHTCTLASGIPLGGLGTGSFEIRADGCFYDWEIFNNYLWSGNPNQTPPEMWSEDAFFALRVRAEGQEPKVRLLYDDDKRSRAADPHYTYAMMYNFPFLRNVPKITYSGQFPFAHLVYDDPSLPVDIALEAFTPFIPFNSKDSGLPLAFFTFKVRNRGETACEVSLMFSMRNCAGYDQDALTLHHNVMRTEAMTGIAMTAADLDAAQRTYGSLLVAALADDATVMPAWTDGHGRLGFENAQAPAMCQLFYPFRDEGVLASDEDEWTRRLAREDIEPACGVLHYPQYQQGWRWRGAVCQKIALQPGEEQDLVFLLSWHFPNHYHYFAGDQNLGHMYENWFGNAQDVGRYAVQNHARLRQQSRAFSDHLYQGTLPAWLAASLNAQLTTFPQSFWWTKNGEFAGWEGSACCQIIPDIHTPWSSFQSLLFFPDLYLQMKRKLSFWGTNKAQRDPEQVSFLDLEQQRREAARRVRQDRFGGWFEQRFKQYGYTREEVTRPQKPRRWPAAPTEAAAVQLLRDYLWTGKRAFLQDMWPAVKENIELGIQEDVNQDGLQDGVLSFITYDHWFLPAVNCYKASMWLAELKAAARIAAILGEAETVTRLEALVQKGANSFEKLLWNGEYYNLCYDFKRNVADTGCMAEQVSGHLYLRLCGLNPVHDEAHTRAALHAVYRYNRREEEGLLNGADPQGRKDWRYFARFSARGEDEALAGQWVTPWTGTEYYVSALMVAEGLVDEGLAVAEDVYTRYANAGMLYNHIECGEHYFRPMALWALLPALQGLVYDAGQSTLTFAPKLTPDNSDTLFILPGAWGRLVQQRSEASQRNEIHVESGTLALRTLMLRLPPERTTPPSDVQVMLNDEVLPTPWRPHKTQLIVALSINQLKAGQRLKIAIQW